MTELYLDTPTASAEEAAQIVDTYLETAHPKPITSYHKIRGIVRRCLDAGYEAAQIVDALHATEAFTLSAIEYTLRRAKPQTPNPPEHRFWKPEPIERPVKKDAALANIRSIRKGQYE
tara:strand:- start:2779 stop:3132 length:354 start_codon:yes stop_codon:yes gene_type:complete